MPHPSELWTWDSCFSKIRSLSGRNGFPKSRVLSFLGYEVDIETGKIIDIVSGNELISKDRTYSNTSQTIFYVLSAYSDANEVKPSGKRISSKQFRGNQFTRRGFAGETNKLIHSFKSIPHKLVKSVQVFGGHQVNFPVGEIAVELKLLPMVPMLIVLSLPNEEFPAGAWIYFDETIESYFDSEQVYFLTRLAIKRLIELSLKEL
jgi:hypothetical protein